MKSICKQHRNALVFGISILAATLCATLSFANPFDAGTEHTITNDTDFGDTLYVGSENPDNTLIITNDSIALAPDVIIGQYSDSTNNIMSIIGNSLLIVGDSDTNGLATGGIVVGDTNGNSVISVNNASKLEGEYLYVGFGTNDSGKIELAHDTAETEEPTELNIAQDAYVGYAGSTNTVNIGDGSVMNVGNMLTVGLSGSNNHINVSGTLFVNSTTNINVVDADADNGIAIKNGGTLQVGGAVDTGTIADLGVDMQGKSTLELGGELTLEDNKLDSGYNVTLNNDLSTNEANWSADSGTYVHVGETTSYNTLAFTNGATGSSSIGLRVGTEESARYNTLSIGGEGSILIAEKSILVGGAGSYNKLNIADGGELQAYETLTVGKNSTASGNEANIGSNGVLNVAGDILVGANGANNKFNMDQGRVATASSFVVGRDSDGNSLNMDGSNSLLTVSQDLIVGGNGGNNTFDMDQGRVSVTNDFILGSGGANNRYNQIGGTNTVSGEFIIGVTEDATGETGFVDNDRVETTGNLAIVGEDATLDIQQTLTVGREGGGSILTIRDGGAVTVSNDVVIGEAVGDNYIYLQRGSNTQFTVTGDLVVGKEGGSNRFAAYGGTADIGGNLYLGATTNQHEIKNFIHLETTNAVLNVAGAIHIGASNSVNTLDLAKGAEAYAQDLFVGAYDGTTNNVVTVNGNDSLLSVSDQLAIGSNTGSNNTVNVGNGGTLFVGGDITVGSSTNDLNNRLSVNSGGTLHTVDWDYATVSTNIVLNSGSTLELDGVFSGTNQLDGGIEVALNGTHAVWENTPTNKLYIGYETDGNTLTIENGAFTTTSTNLIVGNSSKSTGNSLSVTGLSSSVEIGNNLIVGNTGSSGNAMDILGGGEIAVTNNFILGASSDGNRGLLEGFAGTNSTLNVMGNLTVGLNGNWNELRLSSNSVATIDGRATIGAGSNNNTLTLEGSNSVFNVGSNLVVGAGEATGNKLDILGGGNVDVANDFFLGFAGDSNGSLLEGFAGTNSTLHVMGDLTVGLKGAGNNLQISSNAVVTVDGLATIGSGADNNILRLTGSNAVLNVASNLMVGAKTATGNKLEITEGTANLNNDLILGSHTNGNNNVVSVSGSNSTLNVGNDLIVGNIGAGNSLSITDGATAYITNSAWIGLASADNWIEAKGSNSTLTVGNNLYVGSTNEASSGSRLGAYETARIFVGGNLSLATNGTIDIDYDAQIKVDGDYEQDGFAALSVRISTNSATTNLVVDGTANFDEDTTISVIGDGTISELVDEDGNTNTIERTIVTAGALKIADQDATTALLHSSINFQTNALVGFDYTVTNNTIFLNNFIKRNWSDAAGLEGMLADVADEIEGMAAASNEFAQAMDTTFQSGMTGQEINKAMNDYYGEKTSSAPMHNVINQGIGSIASELTVRGDNTRERATAPVPSGAAGPHTWNQGLQGWIAGYGSWGDKSAADGFDAYDANLSGFIIGADLAASKNILFGLAGGSSSGSVDKDNGASGNTKTTYGTVYASVGTKDWFLDGSMIYGSSSIDNTLGEVFDTEADYDAKNLAFYLGGGKEIVGKYLIITPEASLLANYYEQDAYDEKSTDSVARSVDGFDALYVQSSLGCSLGFYMAMGDIALKPELRAHWLHEFNADEESLSYRLIDGSGNPYNMLLQAPEEDILKLGAGVAAKMGEYLELRADIDARLSADYSDYTVAGSLRYQF